MKTLNLTLIIVILSILSGCTKEDLIPGGVSSDNSEENAVLKKAYCGKVFTVAPNGFDDTENLRQAFESAKAAGTGSTVQLLQGLYSIGILEIRDFDGFFHGAGQGKTILSNVPGLLCEEQWIKNLMPSLLSFVGGNILISDITIRINDGDPCAYGPINESSIGDLCCAVILADFTAEYVPVSRQIKGIIDHVDFIAGFDGGHGVFGTPGNVAMALYCGANIGFPGSDNPLSRGEFSIRNCYFEQNVAGPDLFGLDGSSTVIIENNIMNAGLMQIYIAGLMGSNTTIKNNKFHDALMADLWIDENDYGFYPDAKPVKRTRYNIMGNEFQSPSGAISISMTDYRRTVYPEEGFPPLFDIKNNIFKTRDGGIAIQSQNSKDATIWNNKFLGTGSIGIMIDGDLVTKTYAENAKLIGNNFFGANYTDASIYLGPYSRDCKIIGLKTDQVVDEGVNNSVIGTKVHKSSSHHGGYFRRGLKGRSGNWSRRIN